MTDDSAPGWDAIEAVFEGLYPDTPPLHNGAKRDRSVDAPFAVQAWTDGRVWHLTTLGLSELWDKHSETAEVSGWGVELTMLMRREPGQAYPPRWTIGFMRGLAEMVDKARMAPEPGHRVNLTRPIDGEDSEIRGLLFVVDEHLAAGGTLDTPNGSLRFVRAVGISREELALDHARLHATLAALEPPNVTDPGRL